jgi:DNA repair protein RadC
MKIVLYLLTWETYDVLCKSTLCAYRYNSQGQVIADHIVFIGTLNSVIAHPREIFAVAIADHAAEIVVAHNHPSGGLLPSKQDTAMTQQLVASGQIMSIPLMDHVIVTKDGWFSFREHSLSLRSGT